MISFKNHMKTTFLLALMMGIFVLAGSHWGQQGMIIALVLGGMFNVAAWFFSDTLAMKAMRATEVSEAEAPELHAMVRRLSERAGIPMPRVYICPHDAPNAFATGRSPRKAAVAVTQGFLRIADSRELEGVMAHEIAHIKNRDTLISCIAATIAGVLAYMAQMFFWFGGGRREGGHPLLGFLTIILAAVGAAVVQSLISRTREYAADEAGAQIAGSPEGLISALQKLDAYSRRIPLEQPNPAMNNLFIVEPFSRAGRSLLSLFATHPPVEARVQALRELRL
jgi:heat shock protein HtpX